MERAVVDAVDAGIGFPSTSVGARGGDPSGRESGFRHGPGVMAEAGARQEPCIVAMLYPLD